jgi:AraC family ethanolamine operon transcriptional activator
MVLYTDTRRVTVVTHLVEDANAMAQVIADGLQAEYVQLESKSFSGRWSTVRASSVAVQFGSQDIAVVRRLRVGANRWAFMIPLAVPAAARWNGHPIKPGEITICPPNSESLAFDPPSAQFAVITVDPASAAASVARRLTHSAPGALACPCGPKTRVLRDLLVRLRISVDAGKPIESVEIDVSLHEALLACLKTADGRSDAAPVDDRSRTVRRAEAFFRSHIGEGVSIAQLSTVAGVSERSLRNAFYDVYTTSPKRYIKLWQLHQVRRTLQRSEAVATVTNAATCHGFFELGRFAGAYKSLFGETPSETLTKARLRRSVAGAA